MAGFGPTTRGASSSPDGWAYRCRLEAVSADLAATRDELARVRLQLEMFRTWAKRMPNFDNKTVATPTRRPAVPPALTVIANAPAKTAITDPRSTSTTNGSNKEIAEARYLSDRTVKNYLHHAYGESLRSGSS